MKYLMILLIGLLVAGCGELEGKPNEPVPNGGPGTTPNGGFPNATTNSSTNNVATNNVATNNVVTTNNAANNVSTNNLDTCGPLPGAPEQQIGFNGPVDQQGTIVEVTSQVISIDVDGENVQFFSVGIDLTAFFATGETVFIFGEENVSEGPLTTYEKIGFVEGEGAFVEYVQRVEFGEGNLSLNTSTPYWGSNISLGSEIERFQCGEVTECGAQTRTQTMNNADYEGTPVAPFQVAEIEGRTVYVQDAQTLTYDELITEGCVSPASVNGALTVLTAGGF